jgi:ferredoxin
MCSAFPVSSQGRGSLTVEIEGGGRFSCPPRMSVLRAMVAAGRSDIPLGCRSGGCGVCRVRVEHGDFTVGPMSRAQVDAEAATAGVVLACQLFPTTDLRIRALGRRTTTTTRRHP